MRCVLKDCHWIFFNKTRKFFTFFKNLIKCNQQIITDDWILLQSVTAFSFMSVCTQTLLILTHPLSFESMNQAFSSQSRSYIIFLLWTHSNKLIYNTLMCRKSNCPSVYSSNAGISVWLVATPETLGRISTSFKLNTRCYQIATSASPQPRVRMKNRKNSKEKRQKSNFFWES